MPRNRITRGNENRKARNLQQPFSDTFRKAQRHLARRDPLLGQLIQRVGPCTLRPGGDAFELLVRAIIAQMISTKAALAIGERVRASLAPEGLTAAALTMVSEETLRGAGLSRAKALALKDLAGRAHSGALALNRLAEMEDEEVIAALVPVRGIGRWTAEMFLIFSLGRLDVLPVDDFGLRAGIQEVYGLAELPGRPALRERAELWRPYRSIATWYFWRSRGGVPQSE
jgi:DNA-3-methyladenine glycosylase II